MTEDESLEMTRSGFYAQLAGLGYGPDGNGLNEKETKTRLLTLEEARTATGHGWEEIWFSGDAEMEECQMIFECVFIGGHIRGADGDVGEVEEDTYNKPYHSRLWMGEEAPTAEQRKAEKWHG